MKRNSSLSGDIMRIVDGDLSMLISAVPWSDGSAGRRFLKGVITVRNLATHSLLLHGMSVEGGSGISSGALTNAASN